MPHLQFELNLRPPAEEKRRFAEAMVQHFARIMDTGTDHIGITFRCHDADDLVFGRAEQPTRGIAFLDADIRRGRTPDQKRRLALAAIEELNRFWKIPKRSVYVIYTEHDGEHFQLEERVLASWSAGEDPLGDPPR
jgi:phenylpyruvate tautomerase PptA (4-oxalocrotonate tautomerase family)